MQPAVCVIYRFKSDKWDESVVSRARAYWESVGFSCEAEPEQGIRGWRGSLWENLTSFDMKRLVCSLDVRRETDGTIHSILAVNSVFQQLTEWNLADFQLEQLSFRRVLLGLPLPDLSAFRLADRNAKIAWIVSLMRLGRRLPPSYVRLLQELSDGADAPIIAKGQLSTRAPKGGRF